MTNMQNLRRVGQDTAQLTDEELRYIETRVVETARPALVGRRLFPVFKLPHAGFMSVRGFKETDMQQARISLHGQGKNKDRPALSSFDVTVPVIHQEYTLWWRDVLVSRNGGLPIETRQIENAARQCAEEEDKLLLTGEYTGWNALGIEGLATATGRNTQSSGGAWPATAITDISAAIAKLRAAGYYGPFGGILRSNWYGKLETLIANTGIFYIEKVRELLQAGVFISDSLYSSGGLTTSALIVMPDQQNFEMLVGQDLSTFMQQDSDMNLQGKVFEVVAPRINRPLSICEITGLT